MESVCSRAETWELSGAECLREVVTFGTSETFYKREELHEECTGDDE